MPKNEDKKYGIMERLLIVCIVLGIYLILNFMYFAVLPSSYFFHVNEFSVTDINKSNPENYTIIWDRYSRHNTDGYIHDQLTLLNADNNKVIQRRTSEVHIFESGTHRFDATKWFELSYLEEGNYYIRRDITYELPFHVKKVVSVDSNIFKVCK